MRFRSVALAVERSEEIADLLRDLLRVGLQREVSGVEQADIGIRNIALEGFGSRGHEEWVVLAPTARNGGWCFRK